MSGSSLVLNGIPGPYIRAPIANVASYLSENLTTLTPAAITTALQNYVQSNPPSPLPLTAINPDFESNKAEMLNVLSTTNSWADIYTAGIGETLSEMIATAATYNQLSIEKAVQESIIDTAILDSSIYGITRMLGVKIQRRIPAGAPVNIYSPISATLSASLPAFTQFQINGIDYFNRTVITIPASPTWSASTPFSINNTVYPFTINGFTYICTTPGTTGTTEPTWPLTVGSTITDGSVVWTLNSAGLAVVSTTLYQGQANSVSFNTSGVPFEIFEFGNSDFSVSNVDINVTITTGSAVVNYSPTTDENGFSIGLWEFTSSDAVYEESTNADGNVELKLGNGVFGILPVAGSIVDVYFISTAGQEGNINFTGQNVTCSTTTINGAITGVATGPTTQGRDQLSAFDYKNLGPGLFAAKYRAVTPQDYASIARTYPGVIDALFLGQSQFEPSNLAYMMCVQAILLTNTSWSDAQWAAFVVYMTNLGCTNIVLLRVTPTQQVLNVTANVFGTSQADLTSIENQIISNIQSAFTLGVGSLGYTWFPSDIDTIIKNTSNQIDYFVITSPTTSTPASPSSSTYVTIGTITLNMAYSTRQLKG